MGWFTPNKQLTRIHDRTSELLDTVQRQTNELADLRARRRRKRECCGGDQGRETSQGNGSKHLARL